MFKVSRSKLQDDCKILYVLELDIQGVKVVKIGVTSRKVEQRVVEILTSCFQSFREFPYCRPKRFRKVKDAYAKEALLLDYFKEHKYKGHTFDGCTEIFCVGLDEVVRVYEYLLKEGELPSREGDDSGSGREG